MDELPVWVGGKEKIVGGLNRHTRCEDVIAILLQDRYKLSKCELSPQNLQCYALFEKWRGCERQLSPRTRMYKLWKAWGSERENVKFTLRKSVAISTRRGSLDSEVDGVSGGIKLRDHAKHISSQGQYNVKEGVVAYDLKRTKESGKTKEKTKQKRRRSWADESDVGFSDVRILCPPPLDCDSSASTSSSSGKVTAEGPTTLAEEVEGKSQIPPDEDHPDGLVQRILKQSQQLQGLLETIGSVDCEIEYYETRLHYLRVQENGQNYVQESYLSAASRAAGIVGSSDDPKHISEAMRRLSVEERRSGNGERRVPPTPHETVRNLEEYVDLCERLFMVDEELRKRHDTIFNLSQELGSCPAKNLNDAEVLQPSGNSKSKDRNQGRDMTHRQDQSHPTHDIGFARAQLDKTARTCMAQRKELDTLQEQLQQTESTYKDKRNWLKALTNEIERLEHDGEEHDVTADDEEIRACVEISHSTPVNVKAKDNHMESSLDQGIGNDFSPIDVTNRKSPSRSCDTDSSSDTGLSSLHSQDESEQLVYSISETLV